MTSVIPTVRDCGSLPNPVNGLVNTSPGTSEGSVATYSCADGTVLMGTATRFCGSEGIWLPAAPTCDSKIQINQPIVLFIDQ